MDEGSWQLALSGWARWKRPGGWKKGDTQMDLGLTFGLDPCGWDQGQSIFFEDIFFLQHLYPSDWPTLIKS